MLKRILLTLCLCLTLAGCPVNDKPTPVVVVPTPIVGISDEMKLIVAAVEPTTDADLAEFYRDFADIIERDGDVIKTTGHIRECHIRSGKLRFQKTGKQDETPGLGDKVDAAIAEAIGKPNVTLTPELRARAVEVMKALSWACE